MPCLRPNGEIDTLFLTKTAENISFGAAHTYMDHIMVKIHLGAVIIVLSVHTPMLSAANFSNTTPIICRNISALRRDPPEVRVTSGQKPSTKIIYIVLQTSVGLFFKNMFSKKVISSNTKRRKRMLNFV